MDGRLAFALAALLGGMALPLQIGLNGSLRQHLAHPLQATAVSFAVGAATALLLCFLIRTPLPAAERLAGAAPWFWLGGCLGAFYVSTTIFAGPVLGAALVVSLGVLGQAAASLVLDHFGWVGFPRSPVSPLKVIGLALVAGGVAVIAYAKEA